MGIRSTVLAVSFGLSLAFPALAAWQLDNEQSHLSFISIKKSDIAEVHQFKSLAGVVESEEIKFIVDLTSVDTNIAIRDQRMRDFLFETSKFAQATFSAKLSKDSLTSIATGSSKIVNLSGTIALHGQKKEISIDVLVAKLTDKKIIVTAVKPLLVNAKDFTLAGGVAKLQALAGLPSISNAVPVTFVLQFNQE